jgi:hypothetical protein
LFQQDHPREDSGQSERPDAHPDPGTGAEREKARGEAPARLSAAEAEEIGKFGSAG